MLELFIIWYVYIGETMSEHTTSQDIPIVRTCPLFLH
jgi:hypothetical protein